jgi:hypothetical protein
VQPTKPLTTPAVSGPALLHGFCWHYASRFHRAAFFPSFYNILFYGTRSDGVVSLKFLKRFLKQIAKDKHINIHHNYFQIKADAQSFVI